MNRNKRLWHVILLVFIFDEQMNFINRICRLQHFGKIVFEIHLHAKTMGKVRAHFYIIHRILSSWKPWWITIETAHIAWSVCIFVGVEVCVCGRQKLYTKAIVSNRNSRLSCCVYNGPPNESEMMNFRQLTMLFVEHEQILIFYLYKWCCSPLNAQACVSVWIHLFCECSQQDDAVKWVLWST